jgi:tRNA (guanine-N7-)-methyltransferase
VGKKKLIHFQENLTFPHLFQPAYKELFPAFSLRSKWHKAYFGNDHPVSLELGCGKGEYTVGLAMMHPDRNYIGIDLKGARLWKGCKTVSEHMIKNVAFIRTRVVHIEQIFAPGEVSEIWITFPNPQKNKERLRLTAPVFLAKYRNVLVPGGTIHLKTDDLFFFEYTLDVIRENGHTTVWATNDLYHSGTDEDVVAIQTFYEKMWQEMGKKICYVKFQLSRP